MPLLKIEGQLPNGQNTSCVLHIDDYIFKDYRIAFKEDGSCELSCTQELLSTQYHFEGTYTLNGKFVHLTFSRGEMDGDPITGKSEFALYIDGGRVYDDIYKRIVP